MKQPDRSSAAGVRRALHTIYPPDAAGDARLDSLIQQLKTAPGTKPAGGKE